MNAGRAFFDTNILVCLADEESGKSGITEDVLAGGGIISVQVLNEFASVALRKVGLSWTETREFLGIFREILEIVPLTLEVHERGLDLAERYQLNVYDGMIVAAALLAGCTTLYSEDTYSEDTHHGLVIDRLTICNPYAGTGG